MLVHVLHGPEAGHTKPFDTAGGEHAIATGFGRAPTDRERDAYLAATAAAPTQPEVTQAPAPTTRAKAAKRAPRARKAKG